MDGDPRFEENVAPYMDLVRTTGNSNSKGICISKGNGNGKPETEDSSKKKIKCTLCNQKENGECGLSEDQRHNCINKLKVQQSD